MTWREWIQTVEIVQPLGSADDRRLVSAPA
jgi:hypothetical protein